jgi:hypothetical protein
MPLAAVQLLVSIVAAQPTHEGLDRLAIDRLSIMAALGVGPRPACSRASSRRWAWIWTQVLSGLPRSVFPRQILPGAAGPQDVEDPLVMRRMSEDLRTAAVHGVCWSEPRAPAAPTLRPLHHADHWGTLGVPCRGCPPKDAEHTFRLAYLRATSASVTPFPPLTENLFLVRAHEKSSGLLS